MHLIDRYAYTNRLRQVNSAHKAGLTLTIMGLCLILNKLLVGLVAIGGVGLLGIFLAGIPAKVLGRILLAEASFLFLATIGVMLSVSLHDPGVTMLWRVQVGPLWFSTSYQAMLDGSLIVSRALGSAAAMNFLALTTPLVDLIDLGRRSHVPPVLLDISSLIYRYIFILLDTLIRKRSAQESRLGYQTSYLRAMHNAALLASQLFIDAFRRSERLQTALDARGYNGELRVLMPDYQTEPRLLWAGGLLIIGMVGAWLVS
ncbi:cobalt ECF transporter T component CbiQ [Anaerolineales bacterium HSG6]|nr:cobalt ECF transporter T component CbiQ [Anaerolineales bacterium HSG6]